MRRKGLNPAFAMIILVITLVLCVGTSFFILNNQKANLAKLESELPESAISTYFKQIKNDDFDGIFENSLIIDPHLNSKEAYVEALKNIYKDVDVSKLGFVKDKANEDMYQIVNGNVFVSNLKLIKSSDGKWLASTIFTGDNNYTIQVPQGVVLQINGNDLDDSYIIEKDVVANNFKGIPSGSVPFKVNTYEVKNLIKEPEITIKGSGYAMVKDVLSNYYYVGKTPTGVDYETIFASIGKSVARFPTKGGGLNEIPVITNSDFYSRIKTLNNQWYAAHGTAEFSNVKVSDVVMQSDDTMIGNVTMDFLISSSNASKTYHIGYQMTLINDGGKWKIAGFGIDNDLNPANKQ